MMSESFEYAIKKDVRNNPIVREVDTRQRAEFLQTAGVWALIVFMALFAAWQHFERWSHNFTIEQLTHERAEEEAINRRLRLLIETLTAPERIERIATQDLHMVVPPTASRSAAPLTTSMSRMP